jgi:hypothetical protein
MERKKGWFCGNPALDDDESQKKEREEFAQVRVEDEESRN